MTIKVYRIQGKKTLFTDLDKLVYAMENYESLHEGDNIEVFELKPLKLLTREEVLGGKG